MDTLKKLDPFYWFDEVWAKIFGEKKGPAYHVFEIIYAFFVAVAIYTLLGILLNTPKPAVIVVSKSMEPTLYPGDIAVVAGWEINAPEVEYNGEIRIHTRPEELGISFKKGKILFGETEYNLSKEGDIIVYYNDISGRDIIHRVLLKIRAKNGVFYITKGDNSLTNPLPDQDCKYGACVYPFLVSEDQVYGKVLFVIPRIGLIKLWLFGEFTY